MSIFPTRILLATDGSADAELALSTALDIANSTGSELHVLTVGPGNPDPVYRVYEAGLRYETYEQVLEAVEQEARRVLDGQVRKVEEFGGKVAEAYLRMGERRDQAIVRQADEIGAGLIVMGSRVLGGFRRALMGSVSDSVVRHAHCPVMVAAGRLGQREPVLAYLSLPCSLAGRERIGRPANLRPQGVRGLKPRSCRLRLRYRTASSRRRDVGRRSR